MWLPADLFAAGSVLAAGEDGVGGVFWTKPADAAAPDLFFPVTEGTLHLTAAGTEPGTAISGRFSGTVDFPAPPNVTGGAPTAASVAESDLVINGIAAQGDPLDWVELNNTSDSYVALANFVLADDLADSGTRVPFPPDLVIAPRAYLQIEIDKEGWPGFALGKDEELGIWTVVGAPVGGQHERGAGRLRHQLRPPPGRHRPLPDCAHSHPWRSQPRRGRGWPVTPAGPVTTSLKTNFQPHKYAKHSKEGHVSLARRTAILGLSPEPR